MTEFIKAQVVPLDKPLPMWTRQELKAALVTIYISKLGLPVGTVLTEPQLEMLIMRTRPDWRGFRRPQAASGGEST
jgi:hypothetical protein